MDLEDAIEWAHRAEPAEVFISTHPRKTQDALWALVAEVERLSNENELLRQCGTSARDVLKEQVKRLESSLTLSRAEGRKEGLEAAAKIADEHCCDDCKSSGTLCEEKIAAAIREAAQDKEGE